MPDTIRKIWIPLDKWGSHSKGTQSLYLNLSQRCSIVAMASHKAAFDAGEVERLLILVVIILGAEVLIPVAGLAQTKIAPVKSAILIVNDLLAI